MAEVIYITAKQLQDLANTSELLIYDIREADEYARDHILGANNTPMSTFSIDNFNNLTEKTVVFYCQAGNRTKTNEDKFKQLKCSKVFVLNGGLLEWKKLGCAITVDNNAPIPIMRQVQILAGLMILASVVAGFFITSKFFILTGLIGVGLIFSGISGYCGMAKLLMLLPYNNRNKCNSGCV